MGLFIRRAFPLGRFLRINLSQHGLGWSAGIKGARIGQQANGRPYVYGGRGGLYFKEYLNARASRPGSITSGALDFFLIALALAALAAIFAALAV